MKKRTLLFLSALLLATGTLFAKSLVLTLSDGTLVYYLLGKDVNPMMRFVDGKITVNADEYEVSGIKNFYISEEDDPTDIKGADAEGKFTYGANTLVVKAGESAVVKVYGVSGAEVEAEIVKAGGAVSVNLNNLERGVYVVKVGKASFKVIKK
jgi:hypothetical protein